MSTLYRNTGAVAALLMIVVLLAACARTNPDPPAQVSEDLRELAAFMDEATQREMVQVSNDITVLLSPCSQGEHGWNGSFAIVHETGDRSEMSAIVVTDSVANAERHYNSDAGRERLESILGDQSAIRMIEGHAHNPNRC